MQIYINDLVSFDQAITTADFISLHIPLTPTTNKVFNDTTFFARGGVIDEDALVKTLDSEIVAQVNPFLTKYYISLLLYITCSSNYYIYHDFYYVACGAGSS
jgi:hypothetical protein